MKIFEIIYQDDEKQWVAALTNIEAVQEILRTEDGDIDLMKEIRELSEDKWDEMHVVNTDYDENDSEDWESMTFREFIKDVKGCQIISATFYDA